MHIAPATLVDPPFLLPFLCSQLPFFHSIHCGAPRSIRCVFSLVRRMRGVAVLVAVLAVASVARAQCTIGTQQCYVDDDKRVLGPTNVAGLEPITNEYCAWLCASQNFSYFGTESSAECYCGNAIRSDAQKAPAADCNALCNGDPDQKCGGDWRIAIGRVNCAGPVPPPAEKPRMVNPCRNASLPFAKMPFCDATLPIDQRVEDALQRLTLQEKIGEPPCQFCMFRVV